ncbi:MAG: insulinase family protein, partial [Ruminiclostridium sp.]|nr:insulinase family protein [Ruminiclostridium sp.]
MNNEYNRREITDNVFFTSVTDKKFKINKITVCFIFPLSEDASVNAVIPRLLTKCNEKLDTMAEFNRRLAELYSASINWTVLADTDYQICELSDVVLADKFALNGEKISEEIVGILLDCIFSPYFENGFFPQGSL